MIIKCMQVIGSKQEPESIALFLEQEKAYDRVHMSYLKAAMKLYNTPDTIITSITTSLFTTTQIRANVNGHLTLHPYCNREVYDKKIQ